MEETKQDLTIILQSIGDGVISTDPNGAVAFMNPVAEALTGWSRADAVGKPVETVFRIVGEKTREPLENPLSKVLEGAAGEALPHPALLIAKDGTERPVADSAAPIRDHRGEITGAVLVFRDRSEPRRVERLLETRLNLFEFAATAPDLDALLAHALDEICALVDSPIGFYHFVEDDQKTLSLQQWSIRTVKEFCRAEGKGTHYGIDRAGVWADCVRRKRPVIHNDYPSLPQKKGLPDGHAEVIRELAVPILRGDPVVAVLGVGNKPTNYTEKDAETVSYLADVTWQIVDKKRSEERLKENEALFRSIFDDHAAVKLIIDPDTGRIIDANRAAQRYYGWPKDRIQRMRIQDINVLSPEEVKREMDRARRLKEMPFEFRHRHADGSVSDVEVFSSRIVVHGKDLLHSIVHDVTERKRAERMLQESEARYRDLFENAPIGIFSTTSQGKVVSVNAAMARMLGIASPQKAAARGAGFETELYANPEDRKRFLAVLGEKGRVENFGYEARTADGRTVWLSMNARIAVKGEDGTFVIEGFATDLTAQRKLEEQFRQAQKMESMGRLAGGVAHDYNNMLSVILGFAELALERVPASEPLHEDLQEIHRAATRSAEVTRQLLAFARKQTNSPKVIDLNATVEGMLKMLRRLIGEDIDLAWLPGDAVWPVLMDPSQIDQILANLCVNARDALADIGKITIETGRAAFDRAYCDAHPGFIPGDFSLLAVSDNGCGMDKETRKNLFEPFFTTKGVGRGTGLGLATVYGIVKQNNGFINVYSEPGKGTTFKIYFARHEGDAAAHPKEDTDRPPGSRGETVLVVEDEAPILNMSRTMLRRLGYTVLTAGTAEEATSLVKAYDGEIHLLITDVVMPEMNGRDLAERLRALRPGLKALFMSGYTANAIAHHGVLEEGVQFIQKPFSVKELAVKVREALETDQAS